MWMAGWLVGWMDGDGMDSDGTDKLEDTRSEGANCQAAYDTAVDTCTGGKYASARLQFADHRSDIKVKNSVRCGS